jgi:mRNA-binding protein PUF3
MASAWSTSALDLKVPQEEDGRCRSLSSSTDTTASSSVPDSDSSVVSHSPRIAGSVVGNVLSFSRSSEGSRRVQDALDNASSDMEREILVKEMHGHALSAMRCPHANHVLQKCISLMPATSLQFMVDEIVKTAGLVKKVAMHRYGSRVIQQLLGKCEASQLTKLAEALLQDAVALSCHTFGNYSIQRLIRFGTAQQQYRCVRILEQNMGSIAWTTHGVAVVGAAMEHTSSTDRIWVARALLQDPKLLPHLAQKRHGASLVAQIMSELQGEERAQACRSLMVSVSELRASRYGRKAAACLDAFAFDKAHDDVDRR